MELGTDGHHSCPEAILASRIKKKSLSGTWSLLQNSQGELPHALGDLGHLLGSQHEAGWLMSKGQEWGSRQIML